MAFPTHASTTASVDGSGSAKTVDYPATVNEGELLVVHKWAIGNVDSAGDDFELLAGPSTATGNGFTLEVWAKVADGTESGSVTFNISEASLATFHMIRITDWSGSLDDIDFSAFGSGTGSTSNPPQVTASGGSADNLFVALTGHENDGAYTSAPTDYSNLVSTDDGTFTTIGSASRQLAAASDDPGTFSFDDSEPWRAVAFVVPPAGSTAQELTGSRFQVSPSFGTHTVDAEYDLTGNVFQVAPSFGSHTVATGPATLTGTLLQVSPSFGEHTVTPGAVGVTGTVFTVSPTFGAHEVDAEYDLTGNVFQIAPSFGEHTVEPDAVSVTGSAFQVSPSFGDHTVGIGGLLGGQVFQVAPSFGTHTVTAGSVNVNGSIFEVSPLFGTGVVFEPIIHPPGPAKAATSTAGGRAVTASSAGNAATNTGAGSAPTSPSSGSAPVKEN